MRSGGFRVGSNFKFRTTKLLHFKTMFEICTSEVAIREQFQRRRAKIHVRRKLQQHVESAERAYSCPRLLDFVTVRVFERVDDVRRCGRIAWQSDVALLAGP